MLRLAQDLSASVKKTCFSKPSQKKLDARVKKNFLEALQFYEKG